MYTENPPIYQRDSSAVVWCSVWLVPILFPLSSWVLHFPPKLRSISCSEWQNCASSTPLHPLFTFHSSFSTFHHAGCLLFIHFSCEGWAANTLLASGWSLGWLVSWLSGMLSLWEAATTPFVSCHILLGCSLDEREISEQLMSKTSAVSH